MDNVITFAHETIKKHITKDSLVVDATTGNGYDTLFLAKHAKHVYGFDIQEEAIAQTKKRCLAHGYTNTTLFLASHELIQDYIKKPIDAVIFNLGYLPKGDKTITTHWASTIRALNNLFPLLTDGGLVTITIYIGHEEGKEEQNHLEEFFQQLDSKRFSVLRYQHINRPSAPYTVCIKKK